MAYNAKKNAPRNRLRMCWIWFLFSFKCLAIVLPSLEYSSDKNTFFSYISKGFLISQIAFAKNRCFFTKDKFFDTYIFERDLKVWFYRIFILFAFQRYITFADISKIQARRLKKKKVGGGVPVPWMLWYLQYILIHLIKFIEILWHNLTVDLLRQDVNLFIYD